MNADLRHGNEVRAERGRGLLGAQSRADQNAGFRRQVLGKEMCHAFGLPAPFFRKRARIVR
jgi:hypothetical protein